MAQNPTIAKSRIASALGVSRQALYGGGKRKEKDMMLLARILGVLDDHAHYGSRRIADELGINVKSVLRIMRKYGVAPKRRKRRKYRKKWAENPAVPNLAKHRCPIAPDAVWVGDFTEFCFHGRKVFLVTVVDMFTRELLGWNVGTRHDAAFVLRAIVEARRFRGGVAQLFHSDQGSEYRSRMFRGWLLAAGITPSQSAAGRPGENGRQESFFRYFKEEVGDVNVFLTLEELIIAIGKQARYYNERRGHSRLRMSPRAFLELWRNSPPLVRMELARKSKPKTRIRSVN